MVHDFIPNNSPQFSFYQFIYGLVKLIEKSITYV